MANGPVDEYDATYMPFRYSCEELRQLETSKWLDDAYRAMVAVPWQFRRLSISRTGTPSAVQQQTLKIALNIAGLLCNAFDNFSIVEL